MDVVMKSGMWPDLPKMLQTIKRAGYPPVLKDVRLTLSGVIRKRGKGLVIQLDRLKQPLTLTLVPASGAVDIIEHLKQKHLDQTVTIEGLWQGPGKDDKGPGSLAPTFIVAAPEV